MRCFIFLCVHQMAGFSVSVGGLLLYRQYKTDPVAMNNAVSDFIAHPLKYIPGLSGYTARRTEFVADHRAGHGTNSILDASETDNLLEKVEKNEKHEKNLELKAKNLKLMEEQLEMEPPTPKHFDIRI